MDMAIKGSPAATEMSQGEIMCGLQYEGSGTSKYQ
jgi:hypothetical protein